METHNPCKKSENKQPLRLGIICTDTAFAEWQFRCLENLLSLEKVELALLILADNASSIHSLAAQ